MPSLILVKHAAPEVVPGVESAEWRLSDRGRASCAALAEALRPYSPTLIIASEEPKAQETAQLVAHALGIPWRTAPGLHEHDRRGVPHMRSAEFISYVELMLRKRDELVLGNETAGAALNRFSQAVEDVLASQAEDENTVVVSHGTVIALFVADHSDRSAFELWRRLGLPSFVVMLRPEMHVEQVVEQLGPRAE